MDQSRHTLFTLQSTPAAAGLSAEDYVRLLHPLGGWGKVTLMQLDGDHGICSRTYDLESLPNIVGAWLDVSGYVALNRYFGPRGRSPLAALNALYVDLDFRTVAQWRGADPQRVAAAFLKRLKNIGIPVPSFLNDTGRGLAAIWLIAEMPEGALARWQSTMSVLLSLFRSFGADPACTDTTRVFRLPGTINRKSGREVRVIDGSLRRYPFDTLADSIYVAAGRPTREQLKTRKTRSVPKVKSETADCPQKLRGLPAALRFRQIRSDLLRLSKFWGGSVPNGLRNTWLHLYATCLTQEHGVTDLEGDVRAAASKATPGLADNEISGVIRSALRRAEASYASNPNLDGRLNYSGAKIAELLCVSDAQAHQLKLQQIFSVEERTRRWKENATARRREKGIQSREDYLAQNTISAEKPWVDQGISRPTWYRRGCPATPSVERSDQAEDPDETGLCSLQGGLPIGTTRETAKGGLSSLKATQNPHPEKPRKTRNRAETEKKTSEDHLQPRNRQSAI